MLIFSYHRSLPAAFLRLNGKKRLTEMVRSGNVRLIVVSIMFWAMFEPRWMLMPRLEN